MGPLHCQLDQGYMLVVTVKLESTGLILDLFLIFQDVLCPSVLGSVHVILTMVQMALRVDKLFLDGWRTFLGGSSVSSCTELEGISAASSCCFCSISG